MTHPKEAKLLETLLQQDESAPTSVAPEAEAFLRQFEDLKAQVKNLPEYHPTIDLTASAIKQAATPAPSATPRRSHLVEWTVCAAAAVLIIGLAVYPPSRWPTNAAPALIASQTEGSAPPEHHDSFYFSEVEHRHYLRSRETRKRVQSRKSHLANNRYFTSTQKS